MDIFQWLQWSSISSILKNTLFYNENFIFSESLSLHCRWKPTCLSSSWYCFIGPKIGFRNTRDIILNTCMIQTVWINRYDVLAWPFCCYYETTYSCEFDVCYLKEFPSFQYNDINDDMSVDDTDLESFIEYHFAKCAKVGLRLHTTCSFKTNAVK